MDTIKERFIPVSGSLYSTPMIMVADYKWWHDNRTEIESWIAEHMTYGIGALNGMLVICADREEQMMFLLRWGI